MSSSEMQQTREIALACYDNFSEEQKNKAFAIFEAMNPDGSGEISRTEYEECFGSSTGISFEELDTDGNGALDFEEFITLFYILMTSPGETTSPVPLVVTRDQSKHFQPNLLEGFSPIQLNHPQSGEVQGDSFMEEKPSQSDSIGAGSSQSMGEPDSESNGYREAVVKAMEDFNTVLSFGNTISTVAKTARLCTIM